MTSLEKIAELREALLDLERVVVAFSGGADSALLAYLANQVLGDRAVAVTAVSASLAPEELEDCRTLARLWGLRYTEVETAEIDNESYLANGPDRCYHCKSSLMDALEPISSAENATVVLGVNLDDLADHRPGQVAAAERGAKFPFVEAEMTKDDVRAVSHGFGLPTWDKPSAACLASRIPYGTPVSIGVLSQVSAAESALRRLGFRELRVRHYGDLARIELAVSELERAVAERTEIVAAAHAAGYRYVTLDLEGLRSGNLNQGLLVK